MGAVYVRVGQEGPGKTKMLAGEREAAVSVCRAVTETERQLMARIYELLAREETMENNDRELLGLKRVIVMQNFFKRSQRKGPKLIRQLVCKQQRVFSLLETGNLSSACALGKARNTLGKGFAECRTRQRAVGKEPVGKGFFAECHISGTR
jgi:hypothetical protein